MGEPLAVRHDDDDVNENINVFAETFQQITDKHAPVWQFSTKMRKQFRKPWITSAILKRQKLFATHFVSDDRDKVKNYGKKYNNKLNNVKEAPNTNYFKTQFEMYSDKLKATGKLIVSLLEL